MVIKGSSLLHPGCGGEKLPIWLEGAIETRLDIDPRVEPDIVANIIDMGDIGTYDIVYTAHTLEHLYQHEVPVALAEFMRVLNPGGVVMIFVPDLEGVSPDDEFLYESPGGPICGRDLFYGPTRYVECNMYYAHHTGFIQKTLEAELSKAGFSKVTVKRVGDHNLMGIGFK
jgi:SAM-dependent methyltransferase